MVGLMTYMGLLTTVIYVFIIVSYLDKRRLKKEAKKKL